MTIPEPPKPPLVPTPGEVDPPAERQEPEQDRWATESPAEATFEEHEDAAGADESGG